MSDFDISRDLTILVCSCDRYSDCWEPFFKLFYSYWPEGVRCPKIILNTESKRFAYDGLQIECLSLYAPGETVPYGQRLLRHLERIDTEFTLLMLDDFFVRRPIDAARLAQILSAMRAHPETASVYFDQSRYVLPDDGFLPGFLPMARHAMFKLNMQAAVWRTQKLIGYWRPEDTPWEWEVFATYTAFDTDDRFYAIDAWANAPIYYGYNPDGMGVFRGKWVLEDVQPLFQSHGIVVDYRLRGAYDPATTGPLFPNLPRAMAYMLKRVKFRYFFGFSAFNGYKQFLRLFGKQPRYGNHIDYLYAREMQSARLCKGKA